MSEFKFFMETEDKWGDNMKTLWGSLSICPLMTCIRLPQDTAEELDSISHLKIWGNTQSLHQDMAYLLVWVDNTPNAKIYGMAPVWVSLLQTKASSVVEALEILTTFAFKGSNWPYTLIQLYEGANHMPLPENKHLGVLCQEQMESPSGRVSQLKIYQLLSAGQLVVFPMELNGSDQAVTINLSGPLHTGASVTNNKHPCIEVNIPFPTMEEGGCTTLPRGEQHDALTVTIPKTLWKPRVALMEEIHELAVRGMTDNYNLELEHSVVADYATQAEASPPQGTEEPVLPLDTSSQTSVKGMEASVESNPAEATLVAVAHNGRSDSLVQDLQLEVHLAINSIFTAKRTSELERQSAIRDSKTSLHQHEAEAVAANEEAKVAHSQRDLQARIKCAKVIMKAKLNYQVTVQEARAVRCAELQESEATYTEALRETVAKKSRECTSLHREHVEHMQDLEAQAIWAENRSCQDFLLMHQMLPHQAPNSIKEDLYFSYSLLLGSSLPCLQCTPFSPAPQAEVNPPSAIYIKPETEVVFLCLKGGIPLKTYSRTHLVTKTFLLSSQEELFKSQDEGRWPTGKPP